MHFSTKALFINCGMIEKAGMQCVGPHHTWEGMYQMAKTVKEQARGCRCWSWLAKDFDNTMHQFLNYLYSNGGQVIDPDTNKITLNSPQTVETLSVLW